MRLLAAALLAGIAALVAAPGPAAADEGVVVDRTVRDGRITESSGLAPSLLHPGVVWTNNDSGNAPRIYAIGRDGSTAGTLTLAGEPGIDWEAIASFRVPVTAGPTGPGVPLIAVGDIGDNASRHPSVRIAILNEPQRLGQESVQPERVLRLRYPDGPHDAEALLADPATGQLYIVSKQLLGADLYAVPRSLWPGSAADGGQRVSALTTLLKVASLSAALVTDGAFLPDGRILLRGYSRIYLLAGPATATGGRLATLASAALPYQDQGEGLAVIDGGRAALLSSEGRREPVLRVPVPGVAGAGPTATLPTPNPSPAGSSPASSASSASSASDPAGGTGLGPLRTWALLGGGAVVLIAGTLLVLLLRR